MTVHSSFNSNKTSEYLCNNCDVNATNIHHTCTWILPKCCKENWSRKEINQENSLVERFLKVLNLFPAEFFEFSVGIEHIRGRQNGSLFIFIDQVPSGKLVLQFVVSHGRLIKAGKWQCKQETNCPRYRAVADGSVVDFLFVERLF